MADYTVNVAVKVNDGELKSLESRIKSLQNSKANVGLGLGGGNTKQNSANGFNGIVAGYNKAGNAAEKAAKKASTAQAAFVGGLKNDLKNDKFARQYAKSFDDLGKIRNPSRNLSEAAQSFKSAHKDLTTELGKKTTNYDKIIAANDQYANSLEKLKNQTDINKIDQRNLDNINKLNHDRNSFAKDTDIWLKKNSKATGEFGDRIKDVQSKIKGCDRVELNGLKSQFKGITKEAELAGKTGLNFKDSTAKKFRQYMSYFSVASLMFGVTQGARYMYRAVADVDKAMTELKRVTDLSPTQYSDLYDGLTVSAKEYGVALNDIISATADWSRAGFDATTAKGLAEVTTMYQHIADVDYDTAVENLLTAYKGFEGELSNMFGGDTVKAVGYIGDILNELDNNYAVTAAGVGEALQRSASALDVAGNSIQETAGMVTGITEVTQDPEKAGNALKVVSMRLRGMKGGLEDLGEEVDDNVTNLSKMQGQVLNLTRGKVNIFDDTGEFKSTYEIMQGIAGVWKELGSIEQADLLETIAGKHRANDIAAMISNWENVEKATESAINATGSAAEEHAKYVDSIEGRTNILKASFQAFSNTFLNTGLIKGITSGLTGILDILEKIISTIGGLGTAGLIGAMFLGFNKRRGIASIFSGLFTNLSSGVGVLNSFSLAAGKAGDSFKKFMATPMGMFTGIGAAIAVVGTVISLIDNYNQKQRQMRQETIDASNSFSEAYGTFEQLYIKYADKSVLTVDEENELVSAIDGTINALGNKSNALKEAAGASSEYVTSLEQIAKAELTESQRLSKDAQKAAEKQLKKDAGKYPLFSFRNDESVADIQLPDVDSKEYKAVQDLIESDAFQKYVGASYGRDLTKSKEWFRFDDSGGLDSLIEQYNFALDLKNQLLDEANKTGDDSILDSNTYKDASDAVDTMSSGIEELTKQTYNYEKANYQLKNGIATTDEEFYAMKKAVLSNAAASVEARSAIAELMDEEYAGTFDLSSIEAKMNNIKSVTDGIEDIGSKKLNTFEVLLEMRTRVNNGECTVGDYTDYIAQANEAINSIGDLETQEFLRVQLGLKLDEDGNVEDEIQSLKNKLVRDMSSNGVSDEIADLFADGLSATELEAAIKLYAEGELDVSALKTDSAELEKLGADISKTVYGNIDLNNRQALTWTKDNLSKYRSQLESWGDTAEEIAAMEGSVSTVMGAWDTWKINDKEVDIAFSPMLQTENGAELLSKGTATNYIDQLIAKATEDGEWSNEELFKLDAKGLEVDGKKINGLLADIGDTAEQTASSMRYIGIDGALASDIESVEDQIEEEAKRIEAMRFTVNIDLEAENLEKLNSAVTESLSGTGLSTDGMSAVVDMFKGLNDYDPSKLFERTANGMRLNTDEFRKLNNEYQKVNIDGLNDKMSALGDEYLELKEELADLTYGTEEYYAKAGELSDIEAQIKANETLLAQYKGLASEYNEWQMAEAAGNQRDMYESVLSGWETVENEISRGWWDDGTIEFIELLSGKDLSTAGIEEVKTAWDGLGKTIKNTNYSVKDFFTKNENGESDSNGVYNFLDAVGQLEEEAFGGLDIVKRDKNGTPISFDFRLAGGDEAVAEALGVSEELVQIMVRAADDAGFVVSMDGTYQQLDVLKEKAAQAAHELKNTFKATDHDFFQDTSAEGVVKDYGEAMKVWETFKKNKNEDGTVNMSVEGAEEAFTLVSTLQSMVDQLNEPVYMKLKTSEVEKDMQTPLSKLQEYERLTQTEHQLKLKGTDTSEIDTAQGEILDYFEGLEPEVKAQLGIKNLNREELQSKIEAGEIEVPATVDLQVEMNNTLKDMVNVALYNAGVISEKELEARVDVSLYAEEVDSSDVETATIEAVNSAGKESKTVESTTNVEVKAGEVTTSDVESKTKEAVEEVKSTDTSIEQSVDLEVKIDEYNELIQNLEDADKDIKIKVTVDGLDQVEKLNKNIDLATEIDGDVANLSEFVKGAESLSGLDDVISSHVIADIEGNVTGMAEFKINNLKTFADSAKDLKDFGSVTANINANITGNVDDTFEYKINNLKTFADSAKGLKDLGDVHANVEANISGNVDDTFEFKINNLKTFADNAKGLKDLGNVNANVEANINGNVDDTFEFKINNLKTFADSAKGLKDIGDVSANIDANINGNVDDTFEFKIDNLKTLADSAKGLKELGDIDVSVNADIAGNADDTFEYKIDNLKVLADSAKGLKDLGDIDISVSADVDGNVLDTSDGDIDSFKTFAEGAKALEGLENIEANVNANINGNVDDTFEFKLNNLQTFAEGAKELKGLGDVDANITANINGNVDDTFEYKINNLKVLADSAEGLKDIGDVDANINANISGNVDDTFEFKINNLKTFADSAKGLDNLGDVSANVSANIDGNVVDTGEFKINNLKVFADSAKGLDSLGNVDVNVSANVNGNVIDTGEGKLDNLKVFADSAAGLKSVGSPTANVTANIEGELSDGKVSTLSKFASAAQAAKAVGSVVIRVTANVATGAINSAIALLERVSGGGLFKDYNASVNVTANSTNLGSGFTGSGKATMEPDKTDFGNVFTGSGTVSMKPDSYNLGSGFSGTGTVTVTVNEVQGTKVPRFAGTAYSTGSASNSGRAFASGNWGIKESGVALGGELGQELVVRDGRFFTIGDNGAEFFNYRSGDIVFNARQTQELFKYGGIKGAKPRGTMLATGTAFADGSFPFSGRAFNGSSGYGGAGRPGSSTTSSSSSSSSSSSNSGSKSNSNSNSNSSKDDAKEFEETIDWIEKAIDRLERAIDQLDTKLSSTYRSWTERNNSIYDSIGKITDELELQQKAYDRYIKEANSVGLDSKYAEKVKNGTIDIEKITDEDLHEKIQEYSEWYEKALDCKDAILELKEAQSELYETAFEHVATEYEGYLAVIEHEKTMLEEFINQSEERGWIVSGEYYKALIKNQEETIKELKEERDKLTNKMNEAVNDGAIVRGSEAWYEMVQEIDDITASIEEGNTALIEYANNIRDIEWEVFDFLQDQISNITTEAEFLIDLMSNKKLYEDNGQLTDEGMATMGIHGMNYNVHMYQADMYGDEVENLDKQIAEDPYDQELLERRQELLELQQDSIIAAENEKNAIKDMVEEGIDLELDALDNLIEKYLDALDAEKDLYDYQRKVKEQAEEIASIEKQMSAFEGDDSEEAKQKIQELKVSLEEAEADLEETEYDKYIDDQQQLLDELYLEYETILNERLDNIDALVADMIEQINANANGISNTITEQANAVGYNLSNEMKNIWRTDEINGVNSIIAKYGDKFSSLFTTTNTTLGYLHANVQKMISQLNKLAKTNVKAAGASSAAKKKTTTTTTQKPTTTTTKKEDTKKKATDDVMWGIAADIWINGSASGWGNDPYRSGALTSVFGAEAAKEIQNRINKHAHNGDLFKWYGNKDLSKYHRKNFASGGKNINKHQLAWTQEEGTEFIIRPSDGAVLTPIAKGDSVLNAAATNNIWDMANDPSKFIKNNLDMVGVSVPMGSANSNTYIQNLDNVVFSLPNITSYNEFVNALQHDKHFEKLIKSMTVDRLAGGSSLAKTKSIR